MPESPRSSSWLMSKVRSKISLRDLFLERGTGVTYRDLVGERMKPRVISGS